MRKTLPIGLAAAFLALAGTAAQAQSYSNAVMALNPVAYWPLTETAQPPASGMYVATNLGTAGNGFYETWWQTNGATAALFNTNVIVHTPDGAIAGDSDLAMTNNGTTGQFVLFPRYTNGVRNAALNITPPFTVELWAKAVNKTQTGKGLVGQGSFNNILATNMNYKAVSEGFGVGQWAGNYFFVTFNGSGPGTVKTETDITVVPNQWEHIVFTFDGIHQRGYTNGVYRSGNNAPANSLGQTYVPDMISPLLIGTQHGQNTFVGGLDEVAIYPGILSDADILNHYQTGTNADRTTSYSEVVTANNPLVYVRLGEPDFAGVPDSSTYPVASNCGSLGSSANGLYQPGTAPGAAGPAGTGFGASSYAVALDGFNSGVDIGGGNLPSLLNPTNNQPMTVAAWFKANPADCVDRYQVIAGHSDSSWRIGLGTANSDTHFNPGNGPELQFSNVSQVLTNGLYCNDGNWHFMVGSSDGTTDSLYVDGVLAKTNTPVGSIAGSLDDVILGGDPQWMGPVSNGDGGRYFDGSIAHVAFFTNALTAEQVRAVYDSAGAPPLIRVQPASASFYTAGQNITLSALVTGSSPMSYQWYSTNGTSVSGQTSSNLVFNPCVAENSGNYFLVASNPSGSVTSAVVNLTIYGPPTLTQTSLTSLNVFAGSTPKLSLSAIGAQPLDYQWQSNSVVIPGATNSNYTVSASQIGTATYIGTVTNAYGSASTSFTVTVIAAPTAPFPAAVLADSPVAFWRLDEASGLTAYDYVGGYNGIYTNAGPGCGQPTVQGYSASTELSELAPIFGALPGGNNLVGSIPSYLNFASPSNTASAFSVEAWLTDYSQDNEGCIIACGYGNGGEQFDLDLGATTSHYLRFIVRDAAGVAHVANGTSAANPTDGLWHHVVGVCDQANGQLKLYYDGQLNASGTIGTNSGILSSSVPITIGARMGSVSDTGFTNQTIGAIDNVVVYNYALSAAKVEAHYGASGTAPTLSQEPSDVTVNEGGSATFTVAAIGTPPLRFQWYGPLGLITGQTNASLVLNNVTPADQGSYYAIVSNGYGTPQSTPANLIVNSGAPVLVADLQPATQTVWQGDRVTYAVTVQGTMPFSYQWKINGANIDGATGADCTIAAPAGTSTVSVHVSNLSGILSPDPSATLIGTAPSPSHVVDTNAYSSHMMIAIKGYTNDEALVNFPVLVRLSANLPGFSYEQFASPTGGDLRFTLKDGTRSLNHEIERWNPAGESLVWVQVPSMAGTNTAIMAYWGNPAAMEAPDYSTNGSTWKGDFSSVPEFDVVYHLNQGGFPVLDSTLQHSAIAITAPQATVGIAGGGGAFDGTATYTRVDAGAFDLGGNFTLSTWINLTPGATRSEVLWANRPGGWNANGFDLAVGQYGDQDGSLNFDTGDGAAGSLQQNAAGSVSVGVWHQITAAVDSTAHTAKIYQDGTLAFTANLNNTFQTTNNVRLAANLSSDCYVNGAMDEARIESVTRSSNWVWASYETVANNSLFQSYASVSSTYVADKTLHYSVVDGSLVLSWAQGTLQSASQVTGPYNDVTGASAPFPVSATETQQFYRLRIP